MSLLAWYTSAVLAVPSPSAVGVTHVFLRSCDRPACQMPHSPRMSPNWKRSQSWLSVTGMQEVS